MGIPSTEHGASLYDGFDTDPRSTMDDLITEIQEQTNLSKEKVLEVVTIVTDYMKDALPAELVETISAYLADAGDRSSSAVGMATEVAQTAKGVATDATAKAVETAASAFSKAADAVSNVVSPKDA